MNDHFDPKQIAKAKEWAKDRRQGRGTPLHLWDAAVEVVTALPDTIVDGDKLREVVAKHHIDMDNDLMADLGELLPDPAPRTLAELVEAGHAPEEYQWMQAEHRDERCIIIRMLDHDSKLAVSLLTIRGATIWTSTDEVIPLPDKPRLVWPDEFNPEQGEETPTPEVHPKALVTEEDYRNMPRDTVVKDTTYQVRDVWDKWYENEWRTATRSGSSKSHTNAEMVGTGRQVIWAPKVQA